MKTAFFVLGMHRSGTSALGGTLSLLGLEFGSELMKANESNPKGYYENNFVYRLNEKILRENNSSWDDYRFDVSIIDKTKKELYVEEAKKIIEEEFRYATNFVIKDPRICLLFPLWETACQELDIQIKTILPYRNPIEVAASLKKRNNFSYEKSLILWSKHFLSAEYLTRNYQRVFTSFDELIDDTQNTVKVLQDFIGLDVSEKAIGKIQNDFLDSAVKHNNISIANFTQDTPLFLQKILQVIKEKKFEEQVLDEIRKDFLFSLDFFQHQELFDTIEKLRFEKELLEKNRDIAYFDAEYYLAENDDIRAANLNPLEHFMEYGKAEGRHPNAYCAHYHINVKEMVSTSELNYKQNKEIKQKSALIQELQDEVERRGHWGLDLQAQLDNLNSILSQKQQDIEKKSQELQSTSKRLEETQQNKETLAQEKAKQAQELEQRAKTIQGLQEQKAALETQIDIIVNDLASIKESKCWIYTKPIRDLQKVMKK